MTPVPDTRPDPTHLLSAFAQRGLALELPTLELCFLAALHLRAERTALASFTEPALADVFDQVCDLLEPEADARRRATHAIRRLRDQRMLARVDGAGVLRAGEFTLTRLASGIVEFFLEDETLTRESLALLARTLLTSLAEVLVAARARRGTADEWRTAVVAPLEVTVGDLVGGIQRRQRGFDVQQEAFQREVAELLQADWFGAIDRCQSLLELSSRTLRELNQVLLRHAHELQATLHDIRELAIASAIDEAEEAVRSVMDQVDRIAAWGAARQRAWSEYHQYVHRFLRDVVRLDPTRVLTHALRERLAGRSGRAYALAVASAPAIRLLRSVEVPPAERPPVRRRKPEKEAALVDEAPDDPQARLEAEVRAALAAGARGLRDVTARLTEALPREQGFLAAGRIASAVASVCSPGAAAEREWLPVPSGFDIEEWTVEEPR